MANISLSDNSAFFYVDGIPTKGCWIDLDTIGDFDEITEELAEQGYIPLDEDGDPDYGGDILCADAEGLAKQFTSSCDIFDLDGFVAARDHDATDEQKSAYIDCFGDFDPNGFDDRYFGEYDSAEDFAEDFADQLGLLDKDQQWPYNCIDWSYAAREMHDYRESGGHYFRDRPMYKLTVTFKRGQQRIYFGNYERIARMARSIKSAELKLDYV